METSETTAQQHIAVEVVYASPRRQHLVDVLVPVGTTALEAVQLSGIALEFPGMDPASASMGIFSKPLDGKTLPLPQDYRLKARDRVEIYRPLLIDPREARLARAAKAKANRDKELKARD